MEWEPGSMTDSTRWVLTQPGQIIDVQPWDGSVGASTLLTRINNIKPGDVVTMTGFSGSHNDVYVQIFDHTSGSLLGVSAFHLSCSDVDMNGSEDCGKFEGDLKVTSGFTGKINDWVFEGLAGDNAALVCNPTPTSADTCTIQNTPVDCTTEGQPTSLTFHYTSGGCAASNNQQPVGTKFECNDSGFNSTLPIVVTNGDSLGSLKGTQSYTIINDANGNPVSAANPINPGGAFTVSFGGKTFNAESFFTLTNQGGGGTEGVDIHTSCSQPLAAGNVFGSLTLVGFNGAEVGNNVTFTYVITNTSGSVTATNVTVVDDKCGPIAGSPIASLAPGASVTLTCTSSIGTTTVNTVTVSGDPNCSACAKAAVVTPCVLGYPYTSSNPRTSVAFNESGCLAAFEPSVAGPNDTIRTFYTDEHALLLGVSTPGFPVSPFTPDPGKVADFILDPQIGDPSVTDPSARPLFPGLFITDITDDPGVICTAADPTPSRCHDWQFGGTPVRPNAVFGTWKAATKSGTSILTGSDPAKNNLVLDGTGSCTAPSSTCPDPVPSGVVNQGYVSEVRWNVSALGVLPGHVYRMQFMVHDGDQNKSGGDVGEGCATVFVPSPQCQ